MSEIITIAPLLISTGALIMSVATYLRAGRWKDSEAAKEIVDKLQEHESRLSRQETKVINLATQADIARVEADVRGLERTIANVDAGVTRIEQFLMDRAK